MYIHNRLKFMLSILGLEALFSFQPEEDVPSFDVSVAFETSLLLDLDLTFENYTTFFVDPVFFYHDDLFSAPVTLEETNPLLLFARQVEAALHSAESSGTTLFLSLLIR